MNIYLIISLYICRMNLFMINKLFKKIFVFLLCVLMLITSNGYALNKMECTRSGKLTVSFKTDENCCYQTPVSLCHLKKKCCRNTSTFFKTSTCNTLKETRFTAASIFHATNYSGMISVEISGLSHSFQLPVLCYIPPHPRLLYNLLLI